MLLVLSVCPYPTIGKADIGFSTQICAISSCIFQTDLFNISLSTFNVTTDFKMLDF